MRTSDGCSASGLTVLTVRTDVGSGPIPLRHWPPSLTA